MNNITKDSDFELPYADVIKDLLPLIFEALTELCKEIYKGKHSDNADLHKKINEKFIARMRSKDNEHDRLYNDYEHLYLQRRNRPSMDEQEPTRFSNLIINAFVSTETNQANDKMVLLPSPLAILLDLLTVPSEIGSRAYPWVTLRYMLMQQLKIWPEGLGVCPKGYTEFTLRHIEEQLRIIDNYFRKDDNIQMPKNPIRLSDKIKTYLFMLMAAKGLFYLRFGTKDKKTKLTHEEAKQARLAYCDKGRIIDLDEPISHEYRVAPSVERLPELAELANEIWGIPIPIRGADTVFFGGLKFSMEAGLVSLVSGDAGAGKTSFCLALAASLAPLGTRTYFITSEESPKDLAGRFQDITPSYLRRLWPEIFRQDNGSPFEPYRIGPKEFCSAGTGMGRLRKIIKDITDATTLSLDKVSNPSEEGGGLPLPCPFIFVFDGIRSLLPDLNYGESQDYTLDMAVQELRKLRALVILSSASNLEALASLDYLVDIAIRLEYRNTGSFDEKPIRAFILRKTRLQLSRPGAHVFHMSRSEGFRIAPQIPSQLDKRIPTKILLPDKQHTIDVLRRIFSLKFSEKPYHKKAELKIREISESIDIYKNSEVVVHGLGSSGKAGFALKLLTAPIFNTNGSITVYPRQHRILVISFLYPSKYYEYLCRAVQKLLSIEYKNEFEHDTDKDRQPSLDVMHIYPGYLNPQDLVSKIIRKLDQADLEGESYDGVLIDGIQNVFLQFPGLENTPMIWPTIYDLLRRRPLTVVTTHTTFRFEYSSESEPMNLDWSMKQTKPLLHALVQAADFFLEIGPTSLSSNGQGEDKSEAKRFEVKVTSAMYQARPTKTTYWHRENLLFYGADSGQSESIDSSTRNESRRQGLKENSLDPSSV